MVNLVVHAQTVLPGVAAIASQGIIAKVGLLFDHSVENFGPRISLALLDVGLYPPDRSDIAPFFFRIANLTTPPFVDIRHVFNSLLNDVLLAPNAPSNSFGRDLLNFLGLDGPLCDLGFTVPNAGARVIDDQVILRLEILPRHFFPVLNTLGPPAPGQRQCQSFGSSLSNSELNVFARESVDLWRRFYSTNEAATSFSPGVLQASDLRVEIDADTCMRFAEYNVRERIGQGLPGIAAAIRRFLTSHVSTRESTSIPEYYDSSSPDPARIRLTEGVIPSLQEANARLEELREQEGRVREAFLRLRAEIGYVPGFDPDLSINEILEEYRVWLTQVVQYWRGQRPAPPNQYSSAAGFFLHLRGIALHNGVVTSRWLFDDIDGTRLETAFRLRFIDICPLTQADVDADVTASVAIWNRPRGTRIFFVPVRGLALQGRPRIVFTETNDLFIIVDTDISVSVLDSLLCFGPFLPLLTAFLMFLGLGALAPFLLVVTPLLLKWGDDEVDDLIASELMDAIRAFLSDQTAAGTGGVLAALVENVSFDRLSRTRFRIVVRDVDLFVNALLSSDVIDRLGPPTRNRFEPRLLFVQSATGMQLTSRLPDAAAIMAAIESDVGHDVQLQIGHGASGFFEWIDSPDCNDDVPILARYGFSVRNPLQFYTIAVFLPVHAEVFDRSLFGFDPPIFRATPTQRWVLTTSGFLLPPNTTAHFRIEISFEQFQRLGLHAYRNQLRFLVRSTLGNAEFSLSDPFARLRTRYQHIVNQDQEALRRYREACILRRSSMRDTQGRTRPGAGQISGLLVREASEFGYTGFESSGDANRALFREFARSELIDPVVNPVGPERYREANAARPEAGAPALQQAPTETRTISEIALEQATRPEQTTFAWSIRRDG